MAQKDKAKTMTNRSVPNQGGCSLQPAKVLPVPLLLTPLLGRSAFDGVSSELSGISIYAGTMKEAPHTRPKDIVSNVLIFVSIYRPFEQILVIKESMFK
jgi:hypothetical protein